MAPKNLSELAAHLSPDAKRGLEQFRALNGEGRLNETTRAYTDKNGDIDIAKAEKFFASKAMDDAAYQGRLGKIKQQKIDLAQQEVSKIKNIAAETDGTNRPNASVGDGTTEAALMHEVNTGQPLFSKEGHYLKVASYLKDLQAKIVTLQNLRADIDDPLLLGSINDAIDLANSRISSMRPALDAWNNRAILSPLVWGADGLSVHQPGWPKDPSAK